MTNDDFEGDPFKEPDEWRRLRRTVHEWEKHRNVVEAISTVVDAAKIVRAVLPWAVIAGGALLAYLNRAILFGAGG